jgi:hypothetical protein
MMATVSRRSELATLGDELESTWSCLDDLFASFGPADWSRRLGPDWTYRDLPYHLSYFDHDLVVTGLERGRDVPLDEQHVQRTPRELDAWNARWFAARPADETVEQSLARMQRSRDEIRRQIERLSDDDLEAPVFLKLVGCGWVSAGALIGAGVAHTWAHYTEARLRLGRSGPLPSDDATHRTLGFFMGFMPAFASRDEAAKGPFTAVMRFEGPGGGAWTIHAADGVVTSTEGAAPNADLVMTQTADTFEKGHSKIGNPMLLMLTGQIKVKGWRHLGRFGRLMGMPRPDTVIEPIRARL